MNTRQKKRWIFLGITAALILLIAGVWIWFSTHSWDFARDIPQEEATLRLQVVGCAEAWLGAKESNDSHQKILEIYNNHTPLAQGYKVKDTDKWCAAFVSTVAIQMDLTDIIPTECGCQRQIGLFENLGCWEENDSYIPLPGDIIYYSTQGTSVGENTGWSDHVGIVCGTAGNYIKVIEGNVAGKVAVRYLTVGDPSIRGYGLPDYAGAVTKRSAE